MYKYIKFEDGTEGYIQCEALQMQGIQFVKNQEDVSKELIEYFRKNKDDIYNQILEWGLKYVKWFEKGNDVMNYCFGGKDVNELTTQDIANVINTKPSDLKNFKIFEASADDKKRIPSAWFSVGFEWLVDEEHAAAVLFDTKGKAFRITLYSDAWNTIEDWEIKQGLCLHK